MFRWDGRFELRATSKQLEFPTIWTVNLKNNHPCRMTTPLLRCKARQKSCILAGHGGQSASNFTHIQWTRTILRSNPEHLKFLEIIVDEFQEASYDLLNINNLIDTDMIMPVKLLQASGLHVTYWRHSGESGGPIYHQYPPFFYSELRNFAVLSSLRKSALGFRSPDPEDVKGKLSRRWGINIRLQQAKPGRGGS